MGVMSVFVLSCVVVAGSGALIVIAVRRTRRKWRSSYG